MIIIIITSAFEKKRRYCKTKTGCDLSIHRKSYWVRSKNQRISSIIQFVTTDYFELLVQVLNVSC